MPVSEESKPMRRSPPLGGKAPSGQGDLRGGRFRTSPCHHRFPLDSQERIREEEVLDLCRKISEATGITMSLEGIYRWMAFLPSKGNPESPVANRYFGLFKNGKIKARGLSFRRGDMPPLIQEAQMRMIEVLAETEDVEDYPIEDPSRF